MSLTKEEIVRGVVLLKKIVEDIDTEGDIKDFEIIIGKLNRVEYYSKLVREKLLEDYCRVLPS